MTAIRFHVLSHIDRVHHHIAVEVENEHMNAFAAWAKVANAIVFLTDGTVRTPSGAVLVAPDTGDPEPGADVPYPADAVSRKEMTEGKLAALGVHVAKTLPPVVGEVEVALRPAREVASRCLALFACALRAESLASGKEIPTSEIQERMPLAFAALSPKEREFLSAPAPDRQDVVSQLWRYEGLALLGWVLGVVSELPFPTRVCDVPAVAKSMLAANGEGFVEGARLRATGELLDALDLQYRLHWATTDARVKKTPPPASLEPGVVLERHYALNWLTRYQGAEWDDIDTPT